MTITERLLLLHEGCKLLMYQDEKGIWTIAIGHNLQANGLPANVVASIAFRTGLKASGDMPWPDCLNYLQRAGSLQQSEVDMLLAHDLPANCDWLWAKPWWAMIGEPRQAALNDLAFNLGPKTCQEFTTFLGLCAAGDWIAAATDLGANPKLVAEEPKRIANLQQILKTGSTHGVLS